MKSKQHIDQSLKDLVEKEFNKEFDYMIPTKEQEGLQGALNSNDHILLKEFIYQIAEKYSEMKIEEIQKELHWRALEGKGMHATTWDKLNKYLESLKQKGG